MAHWHQANQSHYWPYNTKRLILLPLKYLFFLHHWTIPDLQISRQVPCHWVNWMKCGGGGGRGCSWVGTASALLSCTIHCWTHLPKGWITNQAAGSATWFLLHGWRPSSLGDESLNYGPVGAHMHFLSPTKETLGVHVLDVENASYRSTSSLHHNRSQSMTTQCR